MTNASQEKDVEMKKKMCQFRASQICQLEHFLTECSFRLISLLYGNASKHAMKWIEIILTHTHTNAIHFVHLHSKLFQDNPNKKEIHIMSSAMCVFTPGNISLFCNDKRRKTEIFCPNFCCNFLFNNYMQLSF